MMRHRILLRASAFTALLFVVLSCDSGSSILPNVSGKAGEVMVVIEKGDWEGAPGIVLRDSLTAPCPFLPQREPLYNLVNVTPNNFGQMFQIHRNVVMVHVSPDVNAPGVVYRMDKWARPQLVITVNATDAESAASLLRDNMHDIAGAIEQIERDRVVNNTRVYQERKLAGVADELVGGCNMVFPSGWKLKKMTDDFAWIAYETTYVQQGVFIYKYPAAGVKEEISADALIEKRNSVLKGEVPGMLDGSYMTTSDILRPSVKYAAYKDIRFAEMRGFWDVHGDFMGGPFVSHTFYTPDGRYLVCTEAYVYAPKFDKRIYLRQTESLLYSFEWKKKSASAENATSGPSVTAEHSPAVGY